MLSSPHQHCHSYSFHHQFPHSHSSSFYFITSNSSSVTVWCTNVFTNPDSYPDPHTILSPDPLSNLSANSFLNCFIFTVICPLSKFYSHCRGYSTSISISCSNC
jgi:hypothetical protein